MITDNIYNDPERLYYHLVSHIGTRQARSRREQTLVESCPFCGADNDRHLRASFGQVFEGAGWGFHCFACGRSCSLYYLADLTGAIDKPIVATRERKQRDLSPPEYPAWFSGRESLQKRYTNHPLATQEWGKHKGVTPEMVERYGLGYGVLPGDKSPHSCQHYRLITPILDESGDVVWFRGRGACDCAKWHSASLRDYSISGIGAALPQSHYARPGADVFIVENYVDAALINASKHSGVATLSTSYWFPKWTDQLAALRPGLVFVAFDNDIAGNGGAKEKIAERARIMVARQRGMDAEKIDVIKVTAEQDRFSVDWRIGDLGTGGVQNVPAPRGVVLANHLLERGFDVRLLKWPKGTSDMGDYLTKDRSKH